MQSHGGFEDFQMVVPQEPINQAQRTQRVFNVVLFGTTGISLLVEGIGIMNIMLASVSERTREIGLRRAVGASAAHFLSGLYPALRAASLDPGRWPCAR